MEPKIRHLARISAGFQTRKGVEERADGSHFLLQIRDFNDTRTEVNPQSMARISPGHNIPSEACLRRDDVVFLAKGAQNFAFAVDGLPEPALAAAYFFVLRPKPGLLGAFLGWYLNQETARRHFLRLSTRGAHMPVVRRADLESLTVPLPDLRTQRRIVDFAAIAEEQQRLLAELAEKKKTLAMAACLKAAEKFSITPDHS